MKWKGIEAGKNALRIREELLTGREEILKTIRSFMSGTSKRPCF